VKLTASSNPPTSWIETPPARRERTQGTVRDGTGGQHSEMVGIVLAAGLPDNATPQWGILGLFDSSMVENRLDRLLEVPGSRFRRVP
jgi:hypothetical protein